MFRLHTDARKVIIIYRIALFFNIFYRPVFLRVETRRFGNWISFRPQVKAEDDTYHLGPLERANLNHLKTPVRFRRAI
jgi:hypothetical protein